MTTVEPRLPVSGRAATNGSASLEPIQFPKTTARIHRLANGLTIILQEDRSAPVASLQAWVGTGSIHEERWLGAGLSHLLEHMLFKGTPTRTTSAIAQAVQDEGGYINAYTSFDRTVYWIDVPRAGVLTALEVLADATLNSTLPADEFVKEQEVIRREFAMVMDDPDRVASQQLFATAFRAHPYRHPVIGYLDVFDQLTREDVLAYYRARYAPNNMWFVIVGDVDGEAVCAQLEAFFEAHPQRALPSLYIPAEPPQLGQRTAQRDFPTELSRLAGAWHTPAITNPDVPALDVLATALGEGRSSRLYKRVREGSRLAHCVAAYSYIPAQPGLFGFDATTRAGKPRGRRGGHPGNRRRNPARRHFRPGAGEGEKDHPQQPARRAGDDAWSGERPGLELAAHRQSRFFPRLPSGHSSGGRRGHRARRPALSRRRPVDAHLAGSRRHDGDPPHFGRHGARRGGNPEIRALQRPAPAGARGCPAAAGEH